MKLTWKELCDAYNRQDWPQVKSLATQILAALAQGAQPPDIDGPLQEPTVRGLIVEAACLRFLKEARKAIEGKDHRGQADSHS